MKKVICPNSRTTLSWSMTTLSSSLLQSLTKRQKARSKHHSVKWIRRERTRRSVIRTTWTRSCHPGSTPRAVVCSCVTFLPSPPQPSTFSTCRSNLILKFKTVRPAKPASAPSVRSFSPSASMSWSDRLRSTVLRGASCWSECEMRSKWPSRRTRRCTRAQLLMVCARPWWPNRRRIRSRQTFLSWKPGVVTLTRTSGRTKRKSRPSYERIPRRLSKNWRNIVSTFPTSTISMQTTSRS